MTFARGPSALHRVFLALASAALLVIAFPSFNQSWAAWIALVPWLVLLRDVKARAAFRWSWLIGFVFFLASIWWLVHVTLVGWIVLCAYLALYFGVFGWTVAWLSHDVGQGAGGRGQGTSKNPFSRAPRPLPLVPSLIVIPAIWTVLEYLRSHLLSGFGWNLLAYSQTPWLPIIQFARVTGAWGVSFLIVLLNVSVAGVLIGRQSQAGGDKEPPSDVPLLSACCMLLVAVFGYVLWQVQVKPQSEGAEARVAVVQGNIPQEQKWDEAFQERILTQYETLTRAAAMAHPGLIVWPETSAPGYFGIDEDVTQRVLRLQAAVGRPILLGTPYPRVTPDGLLLMNRATMVNGPSGPWKSYDKLHLVPFGEFVPGDRQMPWLRKVLPPIGDFTPGQSYTVFRTPVASGQWRVANNHSPLTTEHSSLSFAVLICFEDIFPELAREFVLRGAQALVVITNDAWFGPTAAAYQHAQASTFRAVELNVPVIRAANTGWSGCIDQEGHWNERVHDAFGHELFTQGTAICNVRPGGNPPTLYTRWGDWFPVLCAFVTLGWALLTLLAKRRR